MIAQVRLVVVAQRAADGRVPIRNSKYRRWESNPHGRFRPEDFKSSASAIPPRRLLRRSIDRQEMPQKEKAGAARPVRDRRWSDSQSIGPERWNSNPRPSTDLTTVTEAFLSCDQSTWQVKDLQQIHLGSSGQAGRSPTGPWSRWCSGAHRATSRLARSIWAFLFGHGGGGGGIRTHGQAEPVNGFQDRPDQPLWHPSGSSDKRQMADSKWPTDQQYPAARQERGPFTGRPRR